MNPISIVRTGFLLGAGTGILFDNVSYLRSRYVAYGPRSKAFAVANTPLVLLDKLVGYPVPHAWFTHYYALSVCLSIFWGYQLFTRGAIITQIALSSKQPLEESMTLQRIWLAWFLLLVQGYRRLHECIALAKPTKSTMPFVLYLVGLIFYALDSVGVWVEGSATLASLPSLSWVEILWEARFGWTPSLRVILALPVFIIASGIQNDAHRHLSSLKKYTLPEHPIFQWVICPHYLAECVIYISFAIIAAPPGQLVNKTIITTFLFTIVNLGVVAKGTKQWSIEKFGKRAESRWRMIPYVW